MDQIAKTVARVASRASPPQRQTTCQPRCDACSEEEPQYWINLATEPTPEQRLAQLRTLWNDFEPYHPKLTIVLDRLECFVLGAGPLALVLAGNCGCGKTHLASAVFRYLLAGGRMMSEPDMVAHIQAGYSGQGESEMQVLDRLSVAELLVIDDVGTAHVRGESRTWIETIYWRLLDGRARRNRRAMLTTNLDIERLGARLGTRAMSRLMGMMGSKEDGYVDLFEVPDYRTRGWR